jgi:hypothetical protein
VPRSGRIPGVVAIATLAVAAGAAVYQSPVRVVHAAPGAPGFGQPTPSGIVGDGFEQTVALDDTNANQHIVYTSAPVGATTGTSNIWRSLDGGQSFKFIPATIVQGGHPITCPAGGGDSELAVDSAGHLYFADLYLGNFSAGRSDDHGVSFATPPDCQPIPTDAVVDRQWYTTIGDPTNGGALFLVYDRFLQSQTSCPGGGSATTGNALVVTRSPVLGALGATAGQKFTPSLVLTCDEGIMGNDMFYDYTSQGGKPEFFVIRDNFNFDKIALNRCDVVAESATNLQGLTNCVDVTISNFPGSVTGGSFPTLGVDRSGSLFASWVQAPGGRGAVTGDTELMYSQSFNEGTTWTPAKVLPTPGIHQHFQGWVASGDPGHIDVVYYGEAPTWQTGDNNGPDSVSGDWSLYMNQTLDGGTTWTTQLASEHFVHRGTVQTLMGNKAGSRDLGDFLKVAIGPQGEANISYADNNDPNYGGLNPEAFFVRQNSGPGLFAHQDFGAGMGMVNLPAAPTGPCVNDVAGDATLDTASTVGSNNPNLDITQGCMTELDAANYQVKMKISNLTSLGPDAAAGGNTNIWQAQWHVPSATDPHGGALFMAYAESVNGGALTCWVGQASQFNAEFTYPGTTQLPAADCQVSQGTPGMITITVPKADVSEPNPIDNKLYSVAFSTQTVVVDAQTNPQGLVGGQLPNLIDVAPAFDLALAPLPSNVPEVPWVAPLVLVGGGVAAALALRRTRRSNLSDS